MNGESVHNDVSVSGDEKSFSFDVFVEKYKKPIFWIGIVALVFVTYIFSRGIELRSPDAASVFPTTGRTHVVDLNENVIEPTYISLKKGDGVEFVVRDSSRHNITQRRSGQREGDARVESGEFGEGESYMLQFFLKGEYHFYDRLNQDLTLTVIVK